MSSRGRSEPEKLFSCCPETSKCLQELTATQDELLTFSYKDGHFIIGQSFSFHGEIQDAL